MSQCFVEPGAGRRNTLSGEFPNEEAIFGGAVKIADLTERASYLQKACGDDETLRARLDALLASHEDPSSFLGGPVREADGLIGKTLAHYEITEKLGQGGMGEVFRARDTKLGREVAIKVLPPMLARQPDRVARFRREAKLLAALNHPNIGAIHGFEEVGDKRFLVLELVEGDTLSARLAAGPLPIDEALNIGKQIAEALEAAHDRGIIHRDLKPANVVVRTDGTVKVLDFGMAKVIVESGSGATIDPSTLSTIRRNVSQPGMILGTAAYMSPEQARGRALDKRSDIFSFGCVLFELLTADSLFGGETVSDTIGAVLHKEPNWDLVPPKTPPNVQHLLRRCLAKDRNRRLRDMGDARLEIEAALGDSSSTSGGYSAAPSARRRRSFAVVGAAIFGIVAGLVVGGILRRPGGASPRREATTPGVTRFTVEPPAPELVLVEDWFRPSLAVSPDGRHVAYVVEKAGQTHLRVRALDQFESRIMPQTQGAKEPFFSEDGQWLAFFTNSRLKKISLRTNEVVTICEALSAATGGCWDSPQTIVFSGRPAEGLVRVSADGGTPQPVTTPDRANGQFGHMYPRRLHGRRAVLALIRMNDPSQNRIAVFDLDTNDVHPLSVRAVHAQFDPSSGCLVYGQSGTVLAVPFDTDTLAVTGTPILLTDRVFSDYVPLFSVSSEGTLVYVPGAGPARDELVWVDEKGTVESLGLGPGSYDDCPRLSPDGRRLAIGSSIGSRWMMDVWIHDLHRDAAPTRITFNPDADGSMLSAPDGQSLVFSSMRAAPPNLFGES